MDQKDTLKLRAAPEGTLPAGMVERRRPGRMQVVDPSLIPLLRGTAPPLTEAEEEPVEGGGRDQLGAVRGLAFAAIVSGVLWYGLLRLFF